MKICECFLSIDGEGKRTGKPAVFLRKFGCDLRCSYCDTEYAFNCNKDAKDMPVEEVVALVNETAKGCKELTFTGGEPLYYSTSAEKYEAMELLFKLVDDGYHINVETNGSVDLQDWIRVLQTSGFFTMDWKCPSSNMNSKMVLKNLNLLRFNDVLKFVVGTEEDLQEVLRILTAYKPQARVYVSPVFKQMEPSRIVDFLISNRLYDASVQVQLHKIIWGPNQKGV